MPTDNSEPASSSTPQPEQYPGFRIEVTEQSTKYGKIPAIKFVMDPLPASTTTPSTSKSTAPLPSWSRNKRPDWDNWPEWTVSEETKPAPRPLPSVPLPAVQGPEVGLYSGFTPSIAAVDQPTPKKLYTAQTAARATLSGSTYPSTSPYSSRPLGSFQTGGAFGGGARTGGSFGEGSVSQTGGSLGEAASSRSYNRGTGYSSGRSAPFQTGGNLGEGSVSRTGGSLGEGLAGPSSKTNAPVTPELAPGVDSVEELVRRLRKARLEEINKSKPPTPWADSRSRPSWFPKADR